MLIKILSVTHKKLSKTDILKNKIIESHCLGIKSILQTSKKETKLISTYRLDSV